MNLKFNINLITYIKGKYSFDNCMQGDFCHTHYSSRLIDGLIANCLSYVLFENTSFNWKRQHCLEALRM